MYTCAGLLLLMVCLWAAATNPADGAGGSCDTQTSLLGKLLCYFLQNTHQEPQPKPQPKPALPICLMEQNSGGSLPQKYNIPPLDWLSTPSIVEVSTGYYKVIGRNIHAKYLKERLLKKSAVFGRRETNGGADLVNKLEILADTLYIQEEVAINGIKNVKIYAREIVSPPGAKLAFSAPNRTNVYTTPAATGQNGNNGQNGVNGPQVEIFCDVITGALDVTSIGGNGQKGQDGGNGAHGRDNGDDSPDRTAKGCESQRWPWGCHNVPGIKGRKGYTGGNGGNAGTPGNGGNAGGLNVHYRAMNGSFQMKTCAGVGAPAATNGAGGPGGSGSNGGKGRNCYQYYISIGFGCGDSGANGEAPRGENGDSGSRGTTPDEKGNNGQAQQSLLQRGSLDDTNKQSFPLELIRIMRRQAVDLLLTSSSDPKGRDILTFIVSLAETRSDLVQFKKDAQRKLTFLGVDGYDIFGKNKFFAPRVRWNVLETRVERAKAAAKDYEDAFNSVMRIETIDSNFNQMAATMSQITRTSVEGERTRNEMARGVAESEKRMNIKAIKTLEEKMTSIIRNFPTLLRDTYEAAKFNRDDLIAVLQAITGFVSSIASSHPFNFIDSALGLASSLSGKACLRTLDQYLGSVKKWLTFGEKYKALTNSSNLDFDQVAVSSVPEMMQVNLEMNKESFTAELVCLLDSASLPSDVAGLKAEIESFFTLGSARIDLIAKVMDLDNDIGGYNFDISVLQDTENAITAISTNPGSPISTTLRQTFTDNLLSTYEVMERSFMKNIYQLYKAIEFRTLWEGNPLTSFRRVASESAREIKTLVGVSELNKALAKVYRLKDKAVDCFSTHKFTLNLKKWSFDNGTNKVMFEQLASNGSTTFTIDLSQSCQTCYNVRLLKMYIELFGPDDQPANVPAKVYLNLRHRNSSFFRAGDNTIKKYVQPLEPTSLTFNRFTVTDMETCHERQRNGQSTGRYCITSDDNRWESMCADPLSGRLRDVLLGADECISPFGIYELEIPVNRDQVCGSGGITTFNCKDLDVTKFTKMNVWTYAYLWSGQYPTGPDDLMCARSRLRAGFYQTAITTE